MFCRLTKHTSLISGQMGVLVWWVLREYYIPDSSVQALKFSGGGIMVWGSFSGFGLDPFSPVKGNLSALAYQETVDNAHAPSFLETVQDKPFSFPAWLRSSAQQGLEKWIQVWIHQTCVCLSHSTFGVSWSRDWEPGLLIQNLCLNS